MKISGFFTDIFGFGLANFLTKVAPLLIVPVLTRNLTVGEYGSFEILISLSGLAAVFVSMSLESYLARKWNLLKCLSEKKKVFSSLLIPVILLSIFLGFVAFGGSGAFSNVLFTTDRFETAVILSFFSGATIAISGLPLMVLRMERRLNSYLLIVAIQSASYVALVFWLRGQGVISVPAVVFVMFISNTISLIFVFFFVRRYFTLNIDLWELKPSLRHSLPLLPAVAVTLANSQVDKYALLYFFDEKTVGEFAIIAKLASLSAMAVMVFRQAWLPYSYSLARRSDHGEQQIAKVLTAYYIVGLAGCFIVVLFAEPILLFFAPSEYLTEVKILPVLLLSTVVYGSASIVNVGTMVSGKTEWNSYASFVGITLNIFLTVTLVPLYGVSGAAWGTLSSSFVFMLVLSWSSSRLLSINFRQTKVFVLSGAYLICAYSVL